MMHMRSILSEIPFASADRSKECPVYMANVTFEPGCRNNWHIHHADKGGGQILVCTAGEGVYQEWGKSRRFCIRGMWYILNRV